MKRKRKYYISAISFGDAEQVTVKGLSPFAETPEKALEKWCRYSEAYPTCTAIQPETPEDGMELLKWIDGNREKAVEYLQKYRIPYKKDWIMETIRRYVSKGKTSMQWDGDQLEPFSMG